MARRTKTSLFDDLFFIASKLPWWASAAIAVGIYFYLHSVAIAPAAVSPDINQLSTTVLQTIFKVAASFGQYLLPLIFASGMVASLLARKKRRDLLESIAKPGGNTLEGISWQQFERLVGETFRRQGFTVQENDTGGPDGGIDLILRKEGERYLVQCKQWRAMKVSVSIIRELYGVMAAEGAVGGYVITSGRFTEEAKAFATGRNVQLIDGSELNRWIAASQRNRPASSSLMPEPATRVEPTLEASPDPACPKCQAPMVMRTAKQGLNSGNRFWGCSRYPQCRGIQSIEVTRGATKGTTQAP
ncbi:restriction endonuclease [Pseudomonas chlororaphis]|nr:restriction endonuclease [Pseudomonas chlororaphis]